MLSHANAGIEIYDPELSDEGSRQTTIEPRDLVIYLGLEPVLR